MDSIEFCNECGSAMVRFGSEWRCKSCNPNDFETDKQREYHREAVLLTCPICSRQRPYCGAKGAELGGVRLQMGIIRHLESVHDLEEPEQGAAVISCIDQHDVVNIPVEVCKKASDRGWGVYDI